MILETGYDADEKEQEGVLHDATNPYAETRRLEKTDQYMMGPSILVAPVFTSETSRDVVLPNGNWYDFYTGDFAGNGESITIATELEKIPLFVKDGGIIPLMPETNNLSMQPANIPLELRHYGNQEGMYSLYDDDGWTFDYENGLFSVTNLQVQNKDGGLSGSSGNPEGPWKSRYGEIQWRFMTR